mmetsp:Transcript_35099/g.70952  ORF Transcript_35099/g.70952 Transcript_35099/m.70952 type:complete len:175 (-) Transcript_35099:119-643(-)
MAASAATSDSTAIKTVELPTEISVYAKLSTQEIYKTDKGGKLVKFNVDVLLLDGGKLTYQLFKHSVMKNMDSSKSPMSAAGGAVAEATRQCFLVTQGSVGKSGSKITLEGPSEMELDLVQDAHLKCSKEPGIFCRLGRQYSMELQGCDKMTWTSKEGPTKDECLCALADCANLL